MSDSRSAAGSADVLVGWERRADGDVGAPGDVGVPEDVGAPGAVGPCGEWYSRGYLPHRDRISLLQSITFRLADSLPREKLMELEVELASLTAQRRDVERRLRIEQWLDSGMGCCALAHPAVAQYVENSLLHFHGDRYRLLAWCVMPNHVHVLAECRYPLAKIVQGWKSFTARWVLAHNEELHLGIPDPKQLWMREYWDRYIRDDDHMSNVIEYIHNNPVKAGLCQEPAQWRWSSAWPAPGGADVLVGSSPQADGDVGAPKFSRNADVLVGSSQQADGDVGAPKAPEDGGGSKRPNQ